MLCNPSPVIGLQLIVITGVAHEAGTGWGGRWCSHSSMFFLTVLLSAHVWSGCHLRGLFAQPVWGETEKTPNSWELTEGEARSISRGWLLLLCGSLVWEYTTVSPCILTWTNFSVPVDMCFGTRMRAFREHIPRRGILKAWGLGADMLNYSGGCQIVFLGGCTALHSFSTVWESLRSNRDCFF